jgi:hypothetical protein
MIAPSESVTCPVIAGGKLAGAVLADTIEIEMIVRMQPIITRLIWILVLECQKVLKSPRGM